MYLGRVLFVVGSGICKSCNSQDCFKSKTTCAANVHGVRFTFLYVPDVNISNKMSCELSLPSCVQFLLFSTSQRTRLPQPKKLEKKEKEKSTQATGRVH
eukprot:635066-Pelagomonas_calceolata.AAC.1